MCSAHVTLRHPGIGALWLLGGDDCRCASRLVAGSREVATFGAGECRCFVPLGLAFQSGLGCEAARQVCVVCSL